MITNYFFCIFVLFNSLKWKKSNNTHGFPVNFALTSLLDSNEQGCTATNLFKMKSSLGRFLLHFVEKKNCFKQNYTSDKITPEKNAFFYLSELWFSKLRAFRVYYMKLYCIHDTCQSLRFFSPLSMSHINMCGASPTQLEN